LEDLQTEFASSYGAKVETVSRPYTFIEFGKLSLDHVYISIVLCLVSMLMVYICEVLV